MPVDVFREEWMFLDLVSAMVTQPPLRVPLQQSSHNTPRFRRDVRREVEGIGEDSLVHNVHVLVIEWRQASHHLVDEHTESPPVNGLGIPLTLEELGGDIFRCAAESLEVRPDQHPSVSSYRPGRGDSLVAFSVSDIFSLHNPKSQSAMCPV